MAVHDTRQHRVAFGIDGPVGRDPGGGVQLRDPVAFDQQRRDRADGVGEIAGEEFADIRDQCPRHGKSLFFIARTTLSPIAAGDKSRVTTARE